MRQVRQPQTGHSFIPGLVLTVLILWPGTPCGDTLWQTPVRRVVLISCDTLAASHLPSYGYTVQTATTLDSLATEGVLFQRCLVPQGWTLASHMSMFTGLAPGVHRVGKHQALPGEIPLLPEILAQQDWSNAAFLGANQWMDADYGFGRGFQEYQFQNLEYPTPKWGFDWLSKEIAESPLAARTRPYFLFLHFMTPHSRPVDMLYPLPYWAVEGVYNHYFGVPDRPPPQELTIDRRHWKISAYDPTILRSGYDACVAYWDTKRLRVILGHLRDEGLLEETLLIVTSDHGEEIAEHGGHYHDSPYSEVREVPLLMIMPGHLPRGQVVNAPVSIMDITPTILDLAELPPLEVCQGISLRSLWEHPDTDAPPRKFVVDGHRRGYSLEHTALVAHTSGAWWSLIATTDTTQSSGNFRPDRVDSLLGLYNLDSDPGEQTNLLTKHPAVANQLREWLQTELGAESALAEKLGTGQPIEVHISEEEERKLRALGY